VQHFRHSRFGHFAYLPPHPLARKRKLVTEVIIKFLSMHVSPPGGRSLYHPVVPANVGECVLQTGLVNRPGDLCPHTFASRCHGKHLSARPGEQTSPLSRGASGYSGAARTSQDWPGHSGHRSGRLN